MSKASEWANRKPDEITVGDHLAFVDSNEGEPVFRLDNCEMTPNDAVRLARWILATVEDKPEAGVTEVERLCVALAEREQTRSLALGEACLIAAQVATLAERMTSPFKDGVELGCEEIITRLMDAGAPRCALAP